MTNKGCFKIGQEPPNKGKKLAPTTYEKIKNTTKVTNLSHLMDL